jgi:hypothetical protein
MVVDPYADRRDSSTGKSNFSPQQAILPDKATTIDLDANKTRVGLRVHYAATTTANMSISILECCCL